MRLLVLLAALAVGCGPKAATESAVDATPIDATTAPTDWVEIEITEDAGAVEEFGVLDDISACGDLTALEPAAMLGRLNDTQIRCLDKAVRQSPRQTTKDKVSRVLMADAYAKKDMHRWEGAAARHLALIDRSDADLAYLLAGYLARQGPHRADEAMRWADFALERKEIWEGETHKGRVYGLHQIKSFASNKRWIWYETAYLRDPSQENLKQRERWRALAKNSAREWLEWAVEAGMDTQTPLDLCMSASGTILFCQVSDAIVGDSDVTNAAGE